MAILTSRTFGISPTTRYIQYISSLRVIKLTYRVVGHRLMCMILIVRYFGLNRLSRGPSQFTLMKLAMKRILVLVLVMRRVIPTLYQIAQGPSNMTLINWYSGNPTESIGIGGSGSRSIIEIRHIGIPSKYIECYYSLHGI